MLLLKESEDAQDRDSPNKPLNTDIEIINDMANNFLMLLFLNTNKKIPGIWRILNSV